MKYITKHFIFIFLFCFFLNGSFVSFAQSVPQGFNYQTTIRNNIGVILPNQSVRLEFSFYSGAGGTLLQWQETQLVTTDIYGQVKMTIGIGASTGAGAISAFNQINWTGGVYYLKVSMDASGGNNFTDIGTAQLFSVPYAFYAHSANSLNNMSLAEMQDVDTTGLLTNKVLKYNGTYWVPGNDNHHDTVSFSYNAGNSHLTDTAYYVYSNIVPDTVYFSYNSGNTVYATSSGFSTNSLNANYADTAIYALNVTSAIWSLTGNSIGVAANFLGTNDVNDLVFKTNNTERWRVKNTGNVSVGNNVNNGRFAFSGNDGILATGTLGLTTSPSVYGSGTRMMWYPAKAAFRAGGISGNLWDTANVGKYSFAAGYNNKAGNYSFAAGFGCSAGDFDMAIGRKNQVTPTGAFASGGNITAVALGDSCTAGAQRSVSIGRGNVTSASTAVALGTNCKSLGIVSLTIGNNNTANGHYSTAIGNHAVTASNAYGSFMFADNSTSAVAINSTPKSFHVRADSGVVFYTDPLSTMGVRVFGGGGSWSNVSDRTKKENFKVEDCEAILKTIIKLKITSWNYKSQNDNIRHIGPMAQDLYGAYHFGESRQSITTTDMDGIILSGIKALNTRLNHLQDFKNVDELKSEIQEEEKGLDELNKRLDLIENSEIKK